MPLVPELLIAVTSRKPSLTIHWQIIAFVPLYLFALLFLGELCSSIRSVADVTFVR